MTSKHKRITYIKCINCRGHSTYFIKTGDHKVECFKCGLTILLDGPYLRAEPIEHMQFYSLEHSNTFVNMIVPILSQK